MNANHATIAARQNTHFSLQGANLPNGWHEQPDQDHSPDGEDCNLERPVPRRNPSALSDLEPEPWGWKVVTARDVVTNGVSNYGEHYCYVNEPEEPNRHSYLASIG